MRGFNRSILCKKLVAEWYLSYGNSEKKISEGEIECAYVIHVLVKSLFVQKDNHTHCKFNREVDITTSKW